MKIQTVIFTLAVALSTAPVTADHNRTDEAGRKQGHWTEFPEQDDLLAMEGHYVDGKALGKWVWRWANGTVGEGPMVDGKRHGKWVERFVSGYVQEGPYVGGKKHGDWVLRGADGGVQEGPYVGGKKHGRWVFAFC